MDYLNHSLFKSNKQKHVKFAKDVLSVVDGAKTLAHMNMNTWNIPYEQYFQSTFYIKEDTYNQEINYGGLGTQVTLLVLKVSYESILKKERLVRNPEVPHLQYFFATNIDDIRSIDNIMLLSGTKDKKLPKIFLSNPNKTYRAKVEIMACTTDIHTEELPTLNLLDVKTFDIHGLVFNNLVSDDSGTGIIVQKDINTPLMNFSLERLSNIELSGKLMIIDDTAIGKVNLFFINQYECLQAYSLINWALNDMSNNIITADMTADISAPVITYKSTFSTEVNILDYEVCSSCTVDKYLITKYDLIELLIEKVVDDRDGDVYLDETNLTITKINQNLNKEAISEGGKYSLVIDVHDMAGNRKTDVFVLSVTDGKAPRIVLGELGLDFYENSLNGTPQAIQINLANFDGVITQQDILDLAIERIYDDIDGEIPAVTHYVSVKIIDTSLVLHKHITTPGRYSIQFNVIDTHGNSSNVLYNDITALPHRYITIDIS
jgi:hypothetical protein